jgi:hypothetical protein
MGGRRNALKDEERKGKLSLLDKMAFVISDTVYMKINQETTEETLRKTEEAVQWLFSMLK